jgi:hypothetical protein
MSHLWPASEPFWTAFSIGTARLRWVYVHMIEEYARHCGHADLIRERIDGTKGS